MSKRVKRTKPAYAPGAMLFVTHLIIGTDFYTGTEVEVVEVYEGNTEHRYLVRNASRFKCYVYESDLATSPPDGDA